jgi:hypothetical protein
VPISLTRPVGVEPGHSFRGRPPGRPVSRRGLRLAPPSRSRTSPPSSRTSATGSGPTARCGN